MLRIRSALKIFLLLAAVSIFLYSNFYVRILFGVDFFSLIIGENSIGCHIPEYDPFDSQVLEYLKVPPPINCSAHQRPLTFMIGDTIHLNQSTIAKLKKSNSSIEDVQCYYFTIERYVNGSGVMDDAISYENLTKIKSGMRVKEDFIKVVCEYNPGEITFYKNAHAIAQPKPTKKPNGRENTVSVFMLILDSTSRLNFIRQMPKSHKMLTEELGAIYMKGLNKVGDNTYPNMLVMLSGYAESTKTLYAKEDFSPYWEIGPDPHFDDLPMIWKNFSANGYMTLYNEDDSTWHAFNYLNKRGFRVQPTDYYGRPFWICMDAIANNFNVKTNESRCHGHVPKHEILFNYSRDSVLRMAKDNQPYFAYTHSNSISHNYINGLKIIDHDFEKLLRMLKDEGAFENTIVAIMGDHGNRYDDFRVTQLGRVEERMPLLAISLPKSLQHLKAQVQENSKILTSWYDFHEFLLDVATGNTQLPSKVLRHGKRGLSFFRSIPANRTCFQIGVPWEYCVCHKEKSISPTSSRAKEAARILVQHVNMFIKEMDTNKSCVLPLELDEILNAYSLAPPDEENPKTGYIRVAVSVSPSEANLEGIVKTDPLNGSLRVLGEVNRINLYGNQSACVTDVKLKLYCYCKNYVEEDDDKED